MRAAVEDGYSRLIAPAIERETRGGLTDASDNHAIHVFATNLKALLLQPPMRGKVVLGIDPGFRSGCKVAVVDGSGKYLASFTIYPHEPQRERERSKDRCSPAVRALRRGLICQSATARPAARRSSWRGRWWGK